MSFGYGWRGPNIVKDGLVLYLDPGSPNSYYNKTSTTINDISGNGNRGSLINGPTYNSSNGGSITFDGTNQYIDIPFSASFPTGSMPRTLCAFFNVSSISGGKEIFGIGNNSAVGGRSSLWIDSGNTIGVECLATGIVTSSWPGINNWVYLCGVLSSGSTTSHSFKIYVNGILQSTSTLGSNITINSGNTACTIGTVPAAAGAHMFVGRIPIIQLYNRGLSAQEVLQNYNATKSRFGL